jgi:anti-sigma B factor antagonist
VRYDEHRATGQKEGTVDFTAAREGDILTIKVNGRLDASSSAAFESALLKEIDGGHRSILLDMGALEYISSAGLRSLLIGVKKMKGLSGRVVVSSLKEEIRQIFVISGFDKLMSIYPDVPEARKALAPAAAP